MTKTNKGTHYKPRQTEQRSYFLPPGEGDAFKKFNNGDASAGARGALLLMIVFYSFPDIREKMIRAAQNLDWRAIDLDLFPEYLPQEILELQRFVLDAVGHKAIQEWIKGLPEPEKAKLLAGARKKKV